MFKRVSKLKLLFTNFSLRLFFFSFTPFNFMSSQTLSIHPIFPLGLLAVPSSASATTVLTVLPLDMSKPSVWLLWHYLQNSSLHYSGLLTLNAILFLKEIDFINKYVSEKLKRSSVETQTSVRFGYYRFLNTSIPPSTRIPCAWEQSFFLALMTQRDRYTYRKAFHENAAVGVVMTAETASLFSFKGFSSRFIEFKWLVLLIVLLRGKQMIFLFSFIDK